eukprot:TRINITY_DN5102_c0_g1_i2.p1 TRINITY_DN5102_c0_g1~~TRINITY_DN5102_c0_g1_i2.p1  ORF type:complete len:589 (+),score=131.62 TRINITY_DN5102_c0_g1_i2:569-2335(+)
MCGGAVIMVFHGSGALLLFHAVPQDPTALFGLQLCSLETGQSCAMQGFLFNTRSTSVLFPVGPIPAVSDAQELIRVTETGFYEQYSSSLPAWGTLFTNPAGRVTIGLIAGLQRGVGSNVTGSVLFALSPDQVSHTFAALVTDGIEGIYVALPSGKIVASSLENATVPVANSSAVRPLTVAESSVAAVRKSFQHLPGSLSAGETVVSRQTIDGLVIAYTKLVTQYGLEAYIVTLGKESFFKQQQRNAEVASGLVLGFSILFGIATLSCVGAVLVLGLRSITKAVVWLKNDQEDGTSLLVRDEDGEIDKKAMERVTSSGYSLTVWFSEMHHVAAALDQLGENTRELKMFFPSVFVGMTKEDFDQGLHKTRLRTKNVSVIFVDIVKFSPLCVEYESQLQTILQVFLNTVESPVFKKKGLTKRLGDGFMAAFGFASGDDDIGNLCKRAHECSRMMVRNLPKVNRELGRRLPDFPASGIKLRIGIAAGRASIGVVQTESMSNADVYGQVVNTAQRCEGSGHYKGLDDEGRPVLLEPFETPYCTVTVTAEVHAELEAAGELAKYGIEMEPKRVLFKGERTPRTVFAWCGGAPPS